MDNDRLFKVSKYLSKHLRHQPERLGLDIAIGGWVGVDSLLAACAAHRFQLTRAELEEVVARNDKQRFSFDETGKRIRANQGHSIDIDLELTPATPPSVLYHGTGAQIVPLILADGLRKMGRHHVHLSVDVATARRVGARHGRAVVFLIDATGMADAGHEFYLSANGVWLTDNVPPRYLKLV